MAAIKAPTCHTIKAAAAAPAPLIDQSQSAETSPSAKENQAPTVAAENASDRGAAHDVIAPAKTPAAAAIPTSTADSNGGALTEAVARAEMADAAAAAAGTADQPGSALESVTEIPHRP